MLTITEYLWKEYMIEELRVLPDFMNSECDLLCALFDLLTAVLCLETPDRETLRGVLMSDPVSVMNMSREDYSI